MDEDWVLYYITSFTFAVIFGFCYIRYLFTFFERRRIDRASYPSFPFGNVYDVLSQRTPMFMQLWKFYLKLKRKGSSVGGFYIFTKPVILIVRSSQMQTFLSKKKSTSIVDIDSNSPTFDSIGDELTEELLPRVYKNVEKVWNKVQGHFPQENGEVNVTDLMNKITATTIQEFFNIEPSQWSEKKFSNLERETFLSLLRKFLTMTYPKSTNWLTRKDRYEQFCTEVFEKSIKTQDTKTQNLLQILVRNNFSSEEIMDFVQCLIHDLKNVNNLILFILFELSINEEIQEELRHEITKFTRNASHEGLIALPYLEAVICESLRKYPSKSFVCKVCKVDYLLNDVSLPKGSLLFVPIFGIHHDKQYYTDPEIFDPDRFFEGNMKFLDSTKYIPFGCRDEDNFGSQFIRLIMKIILVELLSRFKFSLGPNSPKILDFDGASFEFLKLKNDIMLNVNKL